MGVAGIKRLLRHPMSRKVKAPPAPPSEPALPEEDWRTAPATTEDCLARIRALGRRVEGHVQFMCEAGDLPSASAEAKQQAAVAFYERLRALERMLGQIREELWLR
jgi:hypothetical protein